VIGEALVVAQAVGFVFAAEDADAEFLEVCSLAWPASAKSAGAAKSAFFNIRVLS
jgi:hypothetical protein